MDEKITLDYGSGGLKTSELIESILLPAFKNDALSRLGDGAVLSGNDKLVFSTDSFVVSPPAGTSESFLSAVPSTTCAWPAVNRNI